MKKILCLSMLLMVFNGYSRTDRNDIRSLEKESLLKGPEGDKQAIFLACPKPSYVSAKNMDVTMIVDGNHITIPSKEGVVNFDENQWYSSTMTVPHMPVPKARFSVAGNHVLLCDYWKVQEDGIKNFVFQVKTETDKKCTIVNSSDQAGFTCEL